MLFVPGNSWNFVLSNVSATRPAAGWGTVVTPGTAPTKGAWAQVLTAANKNAETFGILVHINNGSTAATTRNYHVDVGIDAAGGTAYTVVIPDLLGGHSAPATVGGIFYYFPLYIPAGASVAVRASGNVATTFNVGVTVFGKPRRPDSVMAGQKVVAFGATAASATGTTVTPGTTAEGAYVQLGTATTLPLWWWQAGLTCVDTTMSANAHTIDIATGDATNKDIVLQDVLSIWTASEQITTLPAVYPGFDRTATGSLVYGRVQCSGTADSALSMMAYGLG
jgi:hypothetical protein